MAWRVFLSPKWVLLTCLAAVALGAFAWASFWQWDRSQQQLEAEQAGLAAPAVIEEVVSPQDPGVPITALGRQVTVTGEYLPGTQSLVRSRLSEQGEVGFWVLNGVRTDAGSVVAVLRGWSAVQDVAEPTGSVRVAGRLQPDENFYPNAVVSAEDPLVTITMAGLMAQWSNPADGDQISEDPAGATSATSDLLPGFVAATEVTPGSAAVSLVRPVIGVDPDVGFPWRNVAYSLQWLVFAAFVVVMWFRWFREDVRERRADPADGPTEQESAEAAERVSL